MIITLSPSKGQDFESATPSEMFTLPEQLEDSQILINEAKKLDMESVRELMSVSENISTLNVQRFQDWELPFNPQNAKAALKLADRAYVLEVGKITHEGTAEELLNSETIQEAYLGKKH